MSRRQIGHRELVATRASKQSAWNAYHVRPLEMTRQWQVLPTYRADFIIGKLLGCTWQMLARPVKKLAAHIGPPFNHVDHHCIGSQWLLQSRQNHVDIQANAFRWSDAGSRRSNRDR